MNRLPRISVVTPAYRSAATIEQTILSVLAQNYENLEYIVIDGAGDDTADILQAYDDRLAYWCSEPDGGQYHAIKKGFARATGEVLCWINADDKLLPDALQIVGEVFGRFEDVDWISSLLPGRFDAQGYYSGHHELSGFSRETFLAGFNLPGERHFAHFIQQESTFFRRSLWEAIETPFSNFKLAGDFALWCHFYERSELVGISYPLAGFRSIEGQRSDNIDEYLAEAKIALDDLRRHVGHTGRGLLVDQLSLLARMPRLGSKVTERLGFRGKKIVRERHRSADAGWAIKDYKFLPHYRSPKACA